MSGEHRQRIVVGLSGGVDSAVAALLLQRQGHEVTGLFMKNWEEDDTAGHCSAEEDFRIARAVCDRLGIPLHAVNFSAEYWDRVFSYFLAEHRAGRTPNPDVLCNKEIKFKAFLEHALDRGADCIATGHYARARNNHGKYELLKARDRNKDQTYFLYHLGQNELAKVLFPIGEMTKPEVRRLAQKAGLPNHDRKDSTGICFIGERDFKSFLSRYIPAQPGEIRTVDGAYRGRHDGLMYYTLGQRHGLRLGGPGAPWFVVDKDTVNNILIVAQGDYHPALYCPALEAQELHWITGNIPVAVSVRAKTRYRQADQACRVIPLADDRVRVEFEQAQRAVTPGQSVVFYRENECLGGGVIQAALRPAVSPYIKASAG